MTGGLGVLASASAAASAGVMNLALRDDEELDKSERAARKAARNATMGLAPVGAMSGVGAALISAAAGTGGAAVVTSGLSVLGGTMAGGLALMAAIPCAVVGGGGLLAYGIAKAVEEVKAREEKKAREQSDVKAKGSDQNQAAEVGAKVRGPRSSLNRRAAEALVCAILGLEHPHLAACRDAYALWDDVIRAYQSIERDEPEPIRSTKSLEDIRAIPHPLLAHFLRQRNLPRTILEAALAIAESPEAKSE